MGFSSPLFPAMIVKLVLLFICVPCIVVRVANGHAGCPDSFVPCLNDTHCVSIESVCVENTCIESGPNQTCHLCDASSTGSIACVTRLHPLKFECITSNAICDNHQDCINNEDEAFCGVTNCRFDQWLCKGGGCIEKEHICDGQENCRDGSDEGEICHKRPCGPKRMRCPSGVCISESKRCDGIRDCSDGFDEQNCANTSAILSLLKADSCASLPKSFTCSTSSVPTHPICLPPDRVCDGHKDCPEGDDEHDCADECTSRSTCPSSAGISCIQHRVVGQLCRCTKPGYRIAANSSTCQDFDECSDSFGTYCSWECINTDGGFNCTCPDDFTLDAQAQTCRRKDTSKTTLVVLSSGALQVYHVATQAKAYTAKPSSTISIAEEHSFDYLQYDPNQMFVLYYDRFLRAVLCQTDGSSEPTVLLPNLSVHGIAYDSNDRSLFLVENESRTFRMYKPIACEASFNIRMHAWPLTNVSNGIQGLALDADHRQLLFASKHQFMRADLSDPTALKVMHTTDREIQAFIYDASLKRIIWTTTNLTADELFPVFTCNGAFQQCHDTFIRLPSARSFGLLDDALLYSPSSKTSLDTIQLFGTRRFVKDLLTSTQNAIRAFLLLSHRPVELADLCKDTSTPRCNNRMCLQINTSAVDCLPIHENLITKIYTADTMGSPLSNAAKRTQNDAGVTPSANQSGTSRLGAWRIALFLIAIGFVATVFALFGRRLTGCFNRKMPRGGTSSSAQLYIPTDEPTLDEFTVMTDDRTGDQLPLTNQLHY